MGIIRIRDAQVAGPQHPSFGLEKAWYTFGIFAQDGSMTRVMLVEAENAHAVNFLESILQKDGSVSDTCALLSVSAHEPQLRSRAVVEVLYVDFVLDMVDADKWLESPFLVEVWRKSLSDVDKAVASMKMDALILRRAHEQETAETAPQPETSQQDEAKLTQLQAGLTSLGFQKKDVQKFVESVSCRQESLQELLMEGIKTLNRGLS